MHKHQSSETTLKITAMMFERLHLNSDMMDTLTSDEGWPSLFFPPPELVLRRALSTIEDQQVDAIIISLNISVLAYIILFLIETETLSMHRNANASS